MLITCLYYLNRMEIQSTKKGQLSEGKNCEVLRSQWQTTQSPSETHPPFYVQLSPHLAKAPEAIGSFLCLLDSWACSILIFWCSEKGWMDPQKAWFSDLTSQILLSFYCCTDKAIGRSGNAHSATSPLKAPGRQQDSCSLKWNVSDLPWGQLDGSSSKRFQNLKGQPTSGLVVKVLGKLQCVPLQLLPTGQLQAACLFFLPYANNPVSGSGVVTLEGRK